MKWNKDGLQKIRLNEAAHIVGPLKSTAAKIICDTGQGHHIIEDMSMESVVDNSLATICSVDLADGPTAKLSVWHDILRS